MFFPKELIAILNFFLFQILVNVNRIDYFIWIHKLALVQKKILLEYVITKSRKMAMVMLVSETKLCSMRQCMKQIVFNVKVLFITIYIKKDLSLSMIIVIIGVNEWEESKDPCRRVLNV